MEMPIPSQAVIARKTRVVDRLRQVLPADAVISDERETRAYECDALTAYKCAPMVAVLPYTTQQVSDVLRICHEEGVPVVPRGSGTSLAGGALPTADCVILGVARMNEVIETDYPNRIIKVQTGRTNLSVTGAVEEDGFFYAPDPSSQLACAIAGNIAMNSGGAHCLKYGVTTNNLMGVTMVMADGEIVEIGGPHLDSVVVQRGHSQSVPFRLKSFKKAHDRHAAEEDLSFGPNSCRRELDLLHLIKRIQMKRVLGAV